MKHVFLFAVLIVYLQAASSQTTYWQQEVNFNIDVTLNDTDHSLDGIAKIEYLNHSPDTLNFIWFHLWPNAYKNDRTAFSDQLLENGRTDFYFAPATQRGYINRLDFRVNGVLAKTQDHPLHQDLVKLLLPAPLLPNAGIQIQAPFHVQLPFNFSRGGHVAQAYQVTQWYPKPAVYDRKGWHPMPYLDQGEFYSEFGNYQVQITLPKNYVVAATGQLLDEREVNWLREKALAVDSTQAPALTAKGSYSKTKKNIPSYPPSSFELKTIRYSQDRVHDFAWFADKRFSVKQDTIQIAPGKEILAEVFFINLPGREQTWKNSLEIIKQTIRTRSSWLGEYPYRTVKVCEAEMGFAGGMEYPTITAISPLQSASALEDVIEHEVGHNWNQGILASNERQHPWMDEGMNSYYDARFKSLSTAGSEEKEQAGFMGRRIPGDLSHLGLNILIGLKKDQPIELPSEQYSELNYALVPYHKAAAWLKLLEQHLGTPVFDSCMSAFYYKWKFKHPYPEDFREVVETVSGKNLDKEFSLLQTRGSLNPAVKKRPLKLMSFFSLKDTDKFRYIFVAPAAGYNHYDKFMIGGMLHNYTLPAERFQFLLAPLYGTGSKQMNGLGRLSYTWLPGGDGRQVEISLAGASFSATSFTDSVYNTTHLRFTKLAPSIKYVFPNRDLRSKLVKFIQWKTFFISEQALRFGRDPVTGEEMISYPVEHRYLNQLRFGLANSRVLYPYHTEFNLEQGDGFARLAFTGNYYFNYVKAGGLNVRFFAGKFFYLDDKTFSRQFETTRYHLNMTGPKGDEDYTYSNYFVGRNEFEGFASQQIMERDGFFKMRTDLLNNKIGKTDDWLAAINLTTDVPASIDPLKVLPFKIPWKIFVDLGTYSDAWKKNSTDNLLVLNAGIQISLFKDLVNVYLPLIYSKVYKDYINSTMEKKNRLLKTVSFSINVSALTLKKINRNFPL